MGNKNNFRFYFKLAALLVVLTFVGAASWFILRIEKIVVERLPREISIEGISISIIDRSFHLKNVLLKGRIGSPCEGKELIKAKEVKGSFALAPRILKKLKIKDAVFLEKTFQKECFIAPHERDAVLWQTFIPSEGLKVDLQPVRYNIPRWGEAAFSGQFVLREKSPGSLVIDFKNATLQSVLGVLQLKKLQADLEREKNIWRIENMDAALDVTLPQLEKISGVSSPKLTVLKGTASISLNIKVQKARWQVESHIRLTNMRLRGAPLYKAPFQFMELTPETVWPMVEDSPGIFRVAFKSRALVSQLVKTWRKDFRSAMSRKIKNNLKKKIKVLPF